MVPGLLVPFIIQNKPLNTQLPPIPAARLCTSLRVNLVAVVVFMYD